MLLKGGKGRLIIMLLKDVKGRLIIMQALQHDRHCVF